MTLKELCQQHALPYRRCHYAVITGKVRGARLRGRCWAMSEADVPALRAYLSNKTHKKIPGGTCPSS
ncbi:hypothetical protein R5W23_005552 [Gemmata sp. JC673]|uniref:DNA-binding protein n=1 Tax=Gemmata algarum TaxID=2975278 RepID=A0ABU5EVE7_9BACT|nr:hypothetical protein [Gemmata algarum]MDY3558437.1 hypothetical protein [Gemmata algarum]